MVRFLFFSGISDCNVEKKWVKGETRIPFVLITEFWYSLKFCAQGECLT